MTTIIALYVTTQMALQDTVARLHRDDDGQTSMEWLGIAAVIVAIAVFLAGGPARTMGESVRDAFTNLVGNILNA